jgi:hypothetical protein
MKVIKLYGAGESDEREGKELTTHLRRLGHPLARLRASFAGVLDRCGHANLDAMERGRMIHLRSGKHSVVVWPGMR